MAKKTKIDVTHVFAALLQLSDTTNELLNRLSVMTPAISSLSEELHDTRREVAELRTLTQVADRDEGSVFSARKAHDVFMGRGDPALLPDQQQAAKYISELDQKHASLSIPVRVGLRLMLEDVMTGKLARVTEKQT